MKKYTDKEIMDKLDEANSEFAREYDDFEFNKAYAEWNEEQYKESLTEEFEKWLDDISVMYWEAYTFAFNKGYTIKQLKENYEKRS